MNAKRILIINHTHREGQFRGPADVIMENLTALRRPFFLVEHDLCGKGESLLIESSESGERKTLRRIPRPLRNALFRYAGDCFVTLALMRNVRTSGAIDLIIAVNPLNALAGLLLRMWRRGRKVLFISADYTKSRFGTPLLDKLYCMLDKYVSLRADMTGSVSTRIQKLRASFGLPEERNYFFPNTPPASIFSAVQKSSAQQSSTSPVLVSVGSLSDQLSYGTMLDALSVLKHTYPAIHLNIIGSGEKEEELRRMVEEKGLSNMVSFLGRLPHAETLRYVADSTIGLALYSGKWNFNYYGDSMKIREYVGFGVPVITTDTHSTVDDIRRFSAGLVIEDTPEALVAAVNRILELPHYDDYRSGALKMTGKYETVYRDFLHRFFDSP